jgi:heptose I phosphotransferase
MDLPAGRDFHAKQGRSTGQLVLRVDGRELPVYLKRHYRLPFLDGVRALFRPGRGYSPAFQEWDHLQAARAAGLPVPAPVAAGERIGPWGRLQSFLAIEELTGMQALHQAIPAAAERLPAAVFRRWKRGLLAEIARLTCELHKRRWFHNDLYLCHFFVSVDDLDHCPETWRGRIGLIDLHRLHFSPRFGFWQRAKDLAQLLYSSDLPGIDDRDRWRFWRLYVRAENLGLLRRRLLSTVVRLKAQVYERNHRRKTRKSAA